MNQQCNSYFHGDFGRQNLDLTAIKTYGKRFIKLICLLYKIFHVSTDYIFVSRFFKCYSVILRWSFCSLRSANKYLSTITTNDNLHLRLCSTSLFMLTSFYQALSPPQLSVGVAVWVQAVLTTVTVQFYVNTLPCFLKYVGLNCDFRRLLVMFPCLY